MADDVIAVGARLSRRSRMPVFLGLCLVAVSVIYPLWFVVITSVRTNQDYLQDPFGVPGEWTLANYLTLARVYGVGRAFVNSLAVTSISVVIVLVVASLAAYGLAKYPVPGARYITATLVSVMLIPGPVLIIPIYLMLSRLNLVGDYAGLVLVYVATGLPFATFFLTLSFRGIPVEVIEAARIDGAGFFRTLWSVVLPMGSSGIATLAVAAVPGQVARADLRVPPDPRPGPPTAPAPPRGHR